jgi:hypothetical protein
VILVNIIAMAKMQQYMYLNHTLGAPTLLSSGAGFVTAKPRVARTSVVTAVTESAVSGGDFRG